MTRLFLFIALSTFAVHNCNGQSLNTKSETTDSKTKFSAKDDTSLNRIDTLTFKNDSFGAYSRALKKKKHTAILFHAGNLDPFSRRLLAKMNHPEIRKYSQRVVFSFTDADLDKGAEQLVEALGVVRYPTLVVLETNSQKIHVTGRIEGDVDVTELERVLRLATKTPIGKSSTATKRASHYPANDKSIDTTTFINRSFKAYQKALTEKKLTVVLFGQEHGDPYSGKLAARFKHPSIAKYSNQIVFSATNENKDPEGKKLAKALGVFRYPTLVVLNTNKSTLHVVGRIEGLVSTEKIKHVIQKAMKISSRNKPVAK